MKIICKTGPHDRAERMLRQATTRKSFELVLSGDHIEALVQVAAGNGVTQENLEELLDMGLIEAMPDQPDGKDLDGVTEAGELVLGLLALAGVVK